jgi:UDP-glucose 4-epimerase
LSSKKILVTGACGYIGAHTVAELWQAGYEVIGIDNFSKSSPEILKHLKNVSGKDLINYELDLCNLDELKKVFINNDDIDGIIHFAAYKTVPESVAEPLKYYYNNLLGLINVLACIEEYKIKNFVFSSSCSVYGNVETLPVTEDTPTNKTESPYASSKKMGEQIIEDFYKNYNGNVVMLRYFNPVGAHISGLMGEIPMQATDNVFPLLLQTLTGKRKNFTVYGNQYDTIDGTCIRDYIHVSDIAEAHCNALEYLMKAKTKIVDIINLGTGIGISVLQVIESLEKVSNKKLNYTIGKARVGDVVAIYANNAKAKKILNWEPKYTLDEMTKSAWDWENYLLEKKSE